MPEQPRIPASRRSRAWSSCHPPPGSYELQRIQRAPDAALLDAESRIQRLAGLTSGKITLLTFFYTYCVDPWGCPYAYWTLNGLRDRLLAEPQLAAPGALRQRELRPDERYAGRAPALWREIHERSAPRMAVSHRARSVADLLPLLDGFGQDVRVERDANGEPTRTINHMLKMFLIDRDGMVREIYSLAYLQQAVMLNDMRTLALEKRSTAARSR